MIKIFDINDKLLMQAEVTSAAKREQEMSKSDYISLSFSAAEKVILPAGAYIYYTYKIDKVREVTRKFLLLESYEPTQSDECSWKYTPQFQHPKMILSKTPFFIYTRNSQNIEVKQNVWSFVGTTSVLSGKIADFLNKDLMFGECGWKVIFSNVTTNTVNVSFSDNDFISALTAITNAIGDNCEWHIDYDDEIIYIGKVLIGAPVVLEVGKNVGVPSINNSKEGYYNAFSIFGGTRNITQVNSKGENVSSGDIRLQLDEGNGTISIDGKERSYSIDKYSTLDLRVDKINEPLFTKVLDFSQIFPSLNTYVYNVRGRVKYVLDNNKKIPISYNADGSVKEYKTFTVWYMKLAYPTTEKVEGKTIINTTVDDGVTHYWYDFEVTDDLLIKGKNIGCSFEANFNMGALSTPLAGRGTNGDYVGFELIYHKEASSSHTSDDVSKDNFSVLAGDYEIIYQEDNEVIIPTNKEEMLIPRGERLPSLKCNITVLYNIAMADTIYHEDAQNRLLEKSKEEIVRLLSDLNNYEVKSYSDVFLEDNPQLQIGQSVTYKDGHGYELATRVLKLSTNIDYDFIQSITIGNQVIKGTITQLKEDVQTIIASGGSSGNGGGYSVSQLRKLIAKYGSDNFISKQFDDIANGTITFQKIQKFLQGLLIGNSNNENGGSWTPDAEGRSHLITDYLEVRMKAIFEELVINKTSTIGGKEIISPAGGVVAHKVEEVTVTYNNVSQKAYRCYFLAEQDGDEVDNDFAVNDQVRSESFNVRKGTYHKAGNHFYWRLVIGRDEDPVELEGKKYHYIDLSDTDCATASDVPAKGDVLNQCGNRTDVERQNCLIFSAVDTYSPSISLYHGINSYSFANREYVEYGVNKQNNKAFFNVYGDMYFGDRPTSANNYEGESYVKFDSETKKVTIKGDLDIKSTYDGKTLDKYIADKSLDKDAVETIIKKSQTIIDLQNQIDGAIETWFYDGVPTLKNAPAISWKTDNDKKTHLGDLYYDNKTGKAYRFAKDGSTYEWIIITDTELTKALKDSSQALKDAAAADKKANGAQATANTKRRIFGSQPVPPYDVNDMWVNATYPNDGSTYKNEILKCSTAKAEGEKFDIADWKLASKYTDDTKAEEAKKAAEKAQEEIKTTQSNLNALGTTVTENKKTFDSYVKDGYLEPSEIAAMAQDSKRLEDAFAAAEKSYNEVKGAEVLKSTKELTDLNTAFTTLSTAKTELVTYLSDISTNYNKADTNGKAAIVSAVGTKFTNFQSAYSAFYDKLGLANAYITSKIYGDLKQNITDLAGYKYLKDALGQTTYVDGGLVMTTLLALRDGDGNVQSGINGAIDPNRGKKSIATWWGGQMVDKDYNSGNLTPATSLIRFDGSGYLANGAIWWDVSGKVHADPTSFIISEKNLGAYLTFFEPTWKEGSAGTSVADLVSLKPNAPFSKLGVSGDATFEGAISFHGIKITYDATNKAIKIDGNLYATGGITAYGAGASTTGGGGGLNGSVKSYSNALKLTSESLSEIASAYSIKALDSRISSLEGGSAMDVSVSGSGNAVTAISKSGTTIIVTKGTTFLTSHQSLASYLTKADAASLYQPKGNYLTAHQSLDGYVNAIAVSGSGNAVTAVTKSGKTITFTKGATYLTSHQSLSNYYTKSSVDSLLNGKSATTHTHSVKINGITKTIPASGGDAVDLGTYLTTHQSLAAYATQNWVKNEATAHNADMVDNYHASGLFTGFSISDVANKVTISIGGTSKALNLVRAFPSGVGNNFNDIATHGNSMGMSNIAAPYASSTPNYQTLNGYVNPNGQTGWHHYINLSYTDSNNTETSPNMWQTQFAIKAGTTEVYVRSRAGGKISNDAAWAAPWVRLARVTDNVASASKVANALSWSGYSSGSYNGSAVKSISIPNNTNQLTNGAGFITSSASITGNAGSATKLQNARTINGTSFNGTANIVTSYWGTARKLWGNSVNGNADVNGSITIANTDGVYVQIGDVRLVYDKANTAIKVVKSDGTTAANFYATGGISAYGEGSAGTTGSNNFSAKAYADSIKLTSENLSEIASAYSIAVLNNSLNAAIGRISTLEGGSATSIETTGSGNAVTSVSKSGTKITFTKGSTFSLNGHTHTFASLTSKPTSLSGYGITDGVNAVSVTGSGNAITTASISGHTLTLTKGSSFSLSNHTHYVGTTQVQGSSAEQALTGITKIDNILKLSKASVTVNTSYKAEQNRLVIYGSTYGNDANYIKSAGKLSYGDGGPQLVFSTGENPDASGVQSAALVYTDHDTIGAGVSLSFVTNQGDAYFIAPHIKALTAFQGNLAWSYITNKPTTLSGFGITDGLRSVTQPSGSNVFVTGISTSGTAITYTKSYTKKSLSAVGTSGWTNASIDGNIIPDMSFIAYWNGAYSGTSSNLAYCNKGAFGSFAIKNSLAFSELTSKPTTISGYGITDAYTKSQVDTIAAKYLPLTGGTLTGQLKIEASALNGAYNGLRIGDDCYIGDCNFGNTIGLMGVGNNNAGMVKFGKGGMQFGYNGLNHIASTTAQWTNLNADLLDGWHKNNIVWSGAVNSNTASLSHYWAKLFDITVTGNQYDDRNFTFLFSNGFNDTFSVVVLRIRQNGAKDSGAYNFIISLRELVGNMSSRLRVYYNNATGNVQLWGNCQRQYGSLSYTIIKKTGRTSADFTSQGTLVTNTSFSAAQSLPATTGDSPYTLLDGATRIGIVNQADQLVTARTIWGQSFNGTANVSGALSGATTISASNTISTTLQNGALKIGNKLTPISAIDAQVIFNTGAAIRFGETNWDWNQWAGLKYTHSNKTIYLGIADKSVFTANSAQSGGMLKLINCSLEVPGNIAMSDILTVGKNIRLVNMATNVDALFAQLNGNALSIGYGSRMYATTQMWCNKFAIYCNEGIMLLNIDKVTATFETNILATGGVTAYASSDARLKTDLRKLDYLGIIKAMGGTYGFAWKKDNTRSIGWIAQHVLCNPHLKDIVETDEKGYYKINYWSPKLIATAFGAIEQVGDEVSRLKARVVFLESEVLRLSGDKEDCNKKRLDNKNINSLN